ncbi:MAG: septum formation protein Maf [Bacteroidetes bacterium]|nr:septum formation protein Maf [Bacteroidota bacterium]
MLKILLGSKSPRRKFLLKSTELKFKTVNIDSDEDFPANLKYQKVAEYLAIKKSKSFNGNLKGKILLTADTIVWLEGKIINKPLDYNNAVKMLSELSGKKHYVFTGVCLRSEKNQISFTEKSIVYFKNLNEKQINHYIKKYKPFDKAGAYGIQDWIGLTGISKIEGDYFNIMGLPINRVYEYLTEKVYLFY